MRVFISHSSQDKPAVEKLVQALRERAIECWLDKWEIRPGDDIVASINAGLESSAAGLIIFSEHSLHSDWVKAEVSYLTYAHIQERKVLIPIMVSPGCWVPPLLRPLARRGIDEVDAIADALHQRSAGPPPVHRAEHGQTQRVRITLNREPAPGIHVALSIGGQEYGARTHASLSRSLLEARALFLKGYQTGVHRSPAVAERSALEANLAVLGRELRSLCLPGPAGDALTSLVDGCPVGTTVEVCFETGDAELLALPFEALRLPDDRLLATQTAVTVLRRPLGIPPGTPAALAGPLKILVAVGAPDEDRTRSAVLDQERELQCILDAVQPAQRHANVEVRILEVGHPEEIGAAIASDAYHILHLSCHGRPGALELEDESGGAVLTTAEQLIAPIRRAGRPLPMVLLNSCHGGVSEGASASLAEALLRAGVPCVLAMQTSVSDYYATQLARAFYENLAQRETLLPSRALAEARKALEQRRRTALQQNGPVEETQPEYVTAGLFVAASQERPLADFGLNKQPLRVRPVYAVAGSVPQLRRDDLIGRRKELRETLRVLRDPVRVFAGVVLTGIGGVGKSALAGRAMQRLSEDGWWLAVHAGRFDLSGIGLAVGVALQKSDDERVAKLSEVLTRPSLDDRVRLEVLRQALAESPVLLVLDDFEQNLDTGGGAFLEADVELCLQMLAESAQTGRMLITSRYPVPAAKFLHRVTVGPLSLAESRKLLLRLPALREFHSPELVLILRVIGGHPRMLEFLDAILRGGQGRLPHVTKKLEQVLATITPGMAPSVSGLDEALQRALVFGARDVFLEELLGLARRKGIDEVLLQAACSNLPVTPAGIARMLAGGEGDAAAAALAFAKLEDLSLVHRLADGSAWIHRWTAEGLMGLVGKAAQAERQVRAGRYRWWRVANETHSILDAIEAVRNLLAGEDFDGAVTCAKTCFDAMRRFQQALGIAALAAEVLETLPDDHPGFASLGDEEAQAHLALGFTDRARTRYEGLLRLQERLAQAEPDRAGYQRVLSVLYERVGDLYRDLGQGEQARQSYLQSLAIAERLAQAEPDRADYQRDLSVSDERVGDLYRDLGQGEQARQSYLQSLAIRERLAEAEPDRADYQRHLSVSYLKVGDLYRDLGQGEPARQSYLQSLAIVQRLAQAEPDRADYQRDLSVSYNKVGDLYRDLGQGEQARQYYLKDLAIAERLAQAEPDRADYQRHLSVSLTKVASTDHSAAQQLLERALSILEALKNEGRLALRDEPFLQQLRELLRQSGPTG